MAQITLPEGLPGIRGLLVFSPETAKPVADLTQALLRGPRLTAERGYVDCEPYQPLAR
jgi:hypothetical protein